MIRTIILASSGQAGHLTHKKCSGVADKAGLEDRSPFMSLLKVEA